MSLERKHRTKNNEMVYSNYEKVVANFLEEHKVKYIYEPYIIIERSPKRPDFYLPKYDIYILKYLEYIIMKNIINNQKARNIYISMITKN